MVPKFPQLLYRIKAMLVLAINFFRYVIVFIKDEINSILQSIPIICVFVIAGLLILFSLILPVIVYYRRKSRSASDTSQNQILYNTGSSFSTNDMPVNRSNDCSAVVYSNNPVQFLELPPPVYDGPPDSSCFSRRLFAFLQLISNLSTILLQICAMHSGINEDIQARSTIQAPYSL